MRLIVDVELVDDTPDMREKVIETLETILGGWTKYEVAYSFNVKEDK